MALFLDKGRPRGTKIALALVAVGLVAVGALMLVQRQQVASDLNAGPTAPHVIAQPRVDQAPGAEQRAAPRQPAAPTPAPGGKRALYLAKLADPSPKAQMEAYTLAYDCVTRPLLCGDLRPGDVSFDKRKGPLVAAALAGEPGAYVALSRYEITGSTLTKDAYWPDPVEYATLVAQAKEAGIKNSDMTALSEVLAGPNPTAGKPPQEALRLWIELLAAKKWDEEQALYDPKLDNTPRTKALAAMLTPEQQKQTLDVALTHFKQTRGIK